MEIGSRNPFIMTQYGARYEARPPKGGQAEEFDALLESAAQQAGHGRDGVEAGDGQATDLHAFLLGKMEEMRARIKNGTIQPKIQIGAEAYTQEEWQKLLEKVDAAEDALREQIEEEIRTAKEAAQKTEEDSDTRIITRADGTRILMIHTSFGEMCIELSGPDDSAALSEISSVCGQQEGISVGQSQSR